MDMGRQSRCSNVLAVDQLRELPRQVAWLHPGWAMRKRKRGRRALNVGRSDADMRAPSWLLRIFQLTRREYFADFFITPPLTLVLAVVTLRQVAFGWWLIAVVAGWFLWTLYEYSLHRWGLHTLPVLRDIHALHHRDARDYIAVHPAVTLATYAILWATLGFHATALMVGFSLGYVGYAALHTACHYIERPVGFLAIVERRHGFHHRFSRVNYGVSTSLWDQVFRTEYV
jgi:sterol desaturase/sphingolipid hydroxylase (fatty acid hydroxylase superfamily)